MFISRNRSIKWDPGGPRIHEDIGPDTQLLSSAFRWILEAQWLSTSAASGYYRSVSGQRTSLEDIPSDYSPVLTEATSTVHSLHRGTSNTLLRDQLILSALSGLLIIRQSIQSYM